MSSSVWTNVPSVPQGTREELRLEIRATSALCRAETITGWLQGARVGTGAPSIAREEIEGENAWKPIRGN